MRPPFAGFLAPFRRHLGAIKTFMAHMVASRNEAGIPAHGPEDLFPPGWDPVGNPGAMACHPQVSTSALAYRALRILATVAPLLDDAGYGRWAAAEAGRLKAAFNREFLVALPGESLRGYGSQTGTVLALEFRLAPDDARESIIAGLVHDIRERRDKPSGFRPAPASGRRPGITGRRSCP